MSNLVHWADNVADRIIRQKGDRDSYTVASGITPSGTVHFGNFREVITVDFVARALKDRGKNVRFVFSWDDYDTFRKVPLNMPKQEELKEFMFQPIVDTPDPYGKEESYAAFHEKTFENQLGRVGIDVEFLYQAKKYRAQTYNKEIKKTLEKRDEIAEILSEHRKEPLGKDWWPVLVYCEKCNRDRMKSLLYEEDVVSYQCELCDHKGQENVGSSKRLKLPWRLDWPMRWAFESVDFEPGGKDHSSQGGSFTTAKELVSKVYGGESPVYLQYDFVSIKGRGGKMSSSSGEVITLSDILQVYSPEMVRWIFASYKSNVDFSISFDLDVIKMYEDFDRLERQVYGLEPLSEKKKKMAERVYELSQVGEKFTKCPFRPSFRHLCNVLQIQQGNIESAANYFVKNVVPSEEQLDQNLFVERAEKALFWIENFAPDDFKFSLNESLEGLEFPEEIKSFFTSFGVYVSDHWDDCKTDKDLHGKIYEHIHQAELTPGDVFPHFYRLLINREKGPKLASFLKCIGKGKVLNLLKKI